jgi:hypothetical protein
LNASVSSSSRASPSQAGRRRIGHSVEEPRAAYRLPALVVRHVARRGVDQLAQPGETSSLKSRSAAGYWKYGC